jgi:hypothetical protein
MGLFEETMAMNAMNLCEDYWETFKIQPEDIEFLYNHLLENETPLTTVDLLSALVTNRLQREIQVLERQRSAGEMVYLPKESYQAGQRMVFPAFDWKQGQVLAVRPGYNPDLEDFEVIKIGFDGGEEREFACGLANHQLNEPPKIEENDPSLNPQIVLERYSKRLEEVAGNALKENQEFVYIAGRWFPRALLVDVNIGHLNLAEAVLDVAAGGPLPTQALIEQVELPSDVNPKLVEFSLDLALQEDERFDEVGPAGEVAWFLHRLEPEDVRNTPLFLRYQEIDYDRSLLTRAMLDLEQTLDDELSFVVPEEKSADSVELTIIYPHWRAGTLPLTERIARLFPTAYESPRIRFMLVDGQSKKQFPGWVVRLERYVYGLKDWYKERGVMPGSIIQVKRGKKPGEVIVDVDTRRAAKEWVKTVLVGSDGGIVYALLKKQVHTDFDVRLAIAVPDTTNLDLVWTRVAKLQPPFEEVVVRALKELIKLSPQSHVHASELYAAVNIVRRCPPGPILALLVSQPRFSHVGDLHFRYDERED